MKVRLVQEYKTRSQEEDTRCQDKRMRRQNETRAHQKKLPRSRNPKSAFAFAEPLSRNNRRPFHKAQRLHAPKHDTNPNHHEKWRMTMNATPRSIRRPTIALALPRSVSLLIT